MSSIPVKTLLGVTICLCLLTAKADGSKLSNPWSQQKTDATNPPGTATGQKIGTIVKAAVDTAFPVIGKILDIFKSKKPDEKTTQADVQKAVKNAQAEFDKQAKETIKPAGQIADELRVIGVFSAGSVKASINVNTMRSNLATSNPSFDKLRIEWKVAQGHLAEAMKVSGDQLRAVREATLRAKVIDLQDARNDLMIRIDANLDPKLPDTERAQAITDLKEQLKAMSDLLRGFDSIGAVEITMLEDEVTGLVKWANGQRALEDKFRKPNPALMQIADKGLASVRKALTRK